MTVKENLKIQSAVTWSWGWLQKVGDTIETVEPIDSTWTAKAQIRTYPKTGQLLHEFAAEVTDDGVVVITVDPATSEAWTWVDGYYDVKVSNPDQSIVIRVAEGKVTISQEVTHD